MMRAFQIDRAGHSCLTALPQPQVAACEVLIRLRTVGFCGSDLNSYRGLNPLVRYPRVPGHEIAGTVERIGDAVPASAPGLGTDVTVLPYTACGRCAACRRGRSNACQHNETLGVQRDGALTELLAVPWEKVVAADGLSRRALALVEPLSVGVHAVNRGRVVATDTVVVIGCGAVGLGAIAGAHARDARVIAVDIDDDKLALARKAGAAHGVHCEPAALSACIMELTNGEGADVVVEAVGIPGTFVAAVEAVAFTGRVVYIGYAKAPVTYDTTAFVKKELDILGARNATLPDFHAVMAMLRRGEFPIDAAVTRTVSLEEAGIALDDWDRDAHRVTRIHVDIS
ncbi:zinc-binding alcohol dehydrogenase family protein [soil metagenome]